MTIDQHICASGITEIPDLVGDICYHDNRTARENLIISQYPPAGTLVGAGQHMIAVVTEDGNGNATECVHYFQVFGDNQAPTLECPEDISAWLLNGQYEVQDYTQDLIISGGCTIRDKLTITQSPAAGTVLTSAGAHTISFTVTDEFGQIATCGAFVITLKSPRNAKPVVTPPVPPDPTPPYVFQSNLFAYWPLDDLALYRDGSVIFGNTSPRDLTNAGAAIIEPSETLIPCAIPYPGPIFNRGSLFSAAAANAYAYRNDDTALRLQGTDWTVRLGAKLVSYTGVQTWMLVSKYSISAKGYRILWNPVIGNSIEFHIGSGSSVGIIRTSVSINVWLHIVATYSASTHEGKLYVDGALRASASMPLLAGDNHQFFIGDVGANATAYHDEVGIWTEAWSADRVLNDFHLCNCMT